MSVELIPSVGEDFEDYYAIRCGESDIFWMGYAGRPDRELMYNVFNSRLGDHKLDAPGDKRIYMIKSDGKNVGFIQFTMSEEGLEFGISVLDEERHKGYGSAGMKLAVQAARQYSDTCFAHIRDDNYASQHALTGAGLIPTDEFEMKLYPRTGMVAYRLYKLPVSGS